MRPATITVADGQSLNNAPELWPSVAELMGPSFVWTNVSISGVGWAGLAPSAPYRVDTIPKGYARSVIVLNGGQSDILGGSAVDGHTAFKLLADYAEARRNAGFDLVLTTLMPDNAVVNPTRRKDLNEAILKHADDLFDDVIDIDHPEGPSVSTIDGIHFNFVGRDYAAAQIASRLRQVLRWHD